MHDPEYNPGRIPTTIRSDLVERVEMINTLLETFGHKPLVLEEVIDQSVGGFVDAVGPGLDKELPEY